MANVPTCNDGPYILMLEFGFTSSKRTIKMKKTEWMRKSKSFTGPRSLMSWIWANDPNKVGQRFFFILTGCLKSFSSLFQIHGGNRTRWTQDTAPIRNNLIFFLQKRKMNIFCTKSWGIVSFGLFSRTAQAMCLLATERRNPPPKELLDATGPTIHLI